MKAIVLNQYGNPGAFEYKDIDLPKPGKNEVLVKIAIAPVNPSDLIFIGGKNPSQRPLPSAPGFEGAGTVVESGGGDNADQLLNKNVACRALPDRGGTWEQYCVTTAQRCIALLPGVSLEQGAMLLVNPLTGWALLQSAKTQGHKCAIQNAAASALGKMIVRYAQHLNYPIINIVRSAQQVETLKQLGAEHILNSAESDFQSKLKELSHCLNATVAFDAIAGDMCNTILVEMPNGSELWSYGGLSNEPCKIDPMVLIYQSKTVKGFWGPPYTSWLSRSLMQRSSRFKVILAESSPQKSARFTSHQNSLKHWRTTEPAWVVAKFCSTGGDPHDS